MSNIEVVWIDETDEKPLSIDCSVCKKLVATVEDVESIKKYNCCEDCELIYYYPNKEKWDKGWRPEIFND